MKTCNDVVAKWQASRRLIDDLERALRELRDSSQNWELGIEKDERPSVALLWRTLRDERVSLNGLLARSVVVCPDPPEMAGRGRAC